VPGGESRGAVTGDRPGFFEELKRRHVVRVAIAYALAGWLLVQVATQVFPFFNIPTWTVRLVVVLIAIGFPIAVAFAWVYELTPEGIRRTAPAGSPEARPEQEHRHIGRKLNAVIVTVLVLAVALLGWRVYVLRHMPATSSVASAGNGSQGAAKQNAGTVSSAVPDSAARATASRLHPDAVPAPSASIPEKSVAVLPFASESGQNDQQFFSDGLSDDLITALSQFAGLKVISRDSAFQFRNSKATAAKIGMLLGVAHLLEGSVQRAGDEVRITATLVNAADGSIVWSQRYDKPYKDLFALQDAITQSVAAALKAKLLNAPGAVVQSDRPPSGNLAAYIAYQHGMAYAALGTESSVRQAIEAFDDATRLDPKYAAAYARSSGAWTTLAVQYLNGAAEIAQAKNAARKAAATALELDPESSLAHGAKATLLREVNMDWTGAEAEYRHALQLAPSDAAAQFALGSLLASLGQNRQAVELTRQSLARDPRHAGWYLWLGTLSAALGKLDDARTAIGTAMALQPGAAAYHEQLAVVEILRGETKAALAAAEREPDPSWREIAMALASQIGADRTAADASLAKLIKDQANVAPYQIAEVYALRRDPDNTFKWLDRAWTNRDPGLSYLLSDPFVLRYRADSRFAAFCKKVGLPTTTDAVAMK
jgi:TolB-like protein/Tfp pilus assembly protein PilF